MNIDFSGPVSWQGDVHGNLWVRPSGGSDMDWRRMTDDDWAELRRQQDADKELKLAAAMDAFKKHKHLGLASAMRKALEAAR